MNQQPMTVKTNSSPNKNIKQPKKKRRAGNVLFNLLLLVAIGGLGYMFYRAEKARSAAENELQQATSQLEELRNSTQNSGAQVAQEILAKVRAHMDIPAEPAPTVATITNIEQLRENNEFYQIAENGDHLIITEKRAILYDADRDLVLDVVPVRINPASPAPSNTPVASSDPVSASPAQTTPSPAATASPAAN